MQANEGFARPNVQEHTAYAATRYLAWFQGLSEERQQAYDAWIGGMADPANAAAALIEFGETFAEADADQDGRLNMAELEVCERRVHEKRAAKGIPSLT